LDGEGTKKVECARHSMQNESMQKHTSKLEVSNWGCQEMLLLIVQFSIFISPFEHGIYPFHPPGDLRSRTGAVDFGA
jgi:hypothetical protein